MSVPAPETVSSFFESVADDVAEWLPDTRAGGPALAGGIGLGHVFVAVWNLLRETERLGFELGPVIAFPLIAGAGLTVCVLSASLYVSDFDVEKRWLVGWSVVGGAILFGATIYISILVRVAEGRALSEPIFVLSLASGMGSVAGIATGNLYARALRSAAVADRQRDQLEFMQSLFRHDVLNSMTIIKGRAEFLSENTDGENQRFAETIQEYANNIVGLAERVRQMSDVITGQGTVETGPTELRPIVERQVRPLRRATTTSSSRSMSAT